MKKISQWTTYFPITEKNGFGANIWIPARLINGYVVAPRRDVRLLGRRRAGHPGQGLHATAAPSSTAGPSRRARSPAASAPAATTLFNAALRAGYEMGARRNHYYYIDRYPLGLDATVFISGSGSTQTMSFTNDTDYPVLIRGHGWREGGVRLRAASSCTACRTAARCRSVAADRARTSAPPRDSVQYTSSLPAGSRKRIEYPVDGKKV